MSLISEPEYKSKLSYRIVAPDEGYRFYEIVRCNPKYVIAYDIETVESVGKSEQEYDDLTSTEITQIQFAVNKYQAIIFPRLEGEYTKIAQHILKLPNPKMGFNNWNFDDPIIEQSGGIIDPKTTHDLMWMFHHWQPKLPRGLQAVASLAGFPFPWKHLFGTDMEVYGGADVCSLHFILEWLPPIMKARGVWQGYMEYVYKLHHKVLSPAQKLGIPVNDQERLNLKDKLVKMRDDLDHTIQESIPLELRNFEPRRKLRVLDDTTGKEFDFNQYGFAREPRKILDVAVQEYARGVEVLRARGKKAKSFESFVALKYSLVKRQFDTIDTGTGTIVKQERWCRFLPFKASFDQLSRYIRWKHDTLLGSSNKEDVKLGKLYEVPEDQYGKKTTAKGEIEQLAEKTGDNLLGDVLEYRSIGTNLNNYVPNWAPNPKTRCVHTTFGFSAASGQIDSRKPNVLNCSKRTDIGQLFRRIVEAPKGYMFIECVTPDTKVLTWDLRWIPIGEISTGQDLLTFDEYPINLALLRPFKALRKGMVLDKSVLQKPCLKITTDQGIIKCSVDHSFSMRGSNQHKPNYGWKQASKLRVGMKISFFTKPWNVQTDYDAGYIAGFMDGEGWVSNLATGYGQNEGKLGDYVDSLIQSKGFEIRYSANGVTNLSNPDTTCIKRSIQHPEAFGGIRFIGMFRPRRLLEKLQSRLEGSSTWGKKSTAATILSIEDIGVQDVIALKTSTHTYISEGFYSHNCDHKSFHVATMGYAANDKSYIRFSQLDPHSIFASYIMPKEWGKAIDLSLGDEDILDRCKWIKKKSKEEKEKVGDRGIDLRQDVGKKTVLGNQLGLGPRKLYWQNRRSIESISYAKYLQDTLADLFPKVTKFKEDIKHIAAKKTYLINEFGYIQHFFDAVGWTWDKKLEGGRGGWKERFGEEANDAIAFAVQSPAFGIIKDENYRIIPRLQELTEEFTFRLSIHDSLIYLFPERYREEVVQIGLEEMNKPCGKLVNEATGPQGLKVGVEYTIGRNWQKWDKEKNPEGMREE